MMKPEEQRTIERILVRLAALEHAVELLETQEKVRHPSSIANVSNPPTDAELDAEFGTPAVLGDGFVVFIDDNDAGALYWLVATVNGAWAYEQLNLAV